jgi:peroxiredoxin
MMPKTPTIQTPKPRDTAMMTLASELQTFRTAFMGKAPVEIREMMTRADLELLASGILDRTKRSGEAAPDFDLPDARGGRVTLSSLLSSGPVVVSFYRGGWCPYCNLELRALQRVLPELKQLGATLVAISPQTPDKSLSTAEKNDLAFPVLSDAGSNTARAFGIAFDLAEELRPIYAKFGHALPDKNGDDSWVLPIPATFVIAQNGTIAFAYVDIDYRSRIEPSDIIAALETLAAPVGVI